jgi:hypothetical protein
MSESHVPTIRKQPLTPDYQFVPQPGTRKSPIPSRFEGQIPVNMPNGTLVNVPTK